MADRVARLTVSSAEPKRRKLNEAGHGSLLAGIHRLTLLLVIERVGSRRAEGSSGYE